MTEITIDRERLPSPDTFSIDYESIGSFERNANGNLVGDLVAMKTIIAANWRMLDNASFKLILGQTQPLFAKVEYYDPESGSRVEKLMHTRPNGGKVALDVAGQIWWKDVACVFIER